MAAPGPSVVVVGAGPVGVHAVNTLLRRIPHQAIVLYGDEPWAPYNRVALSAFVAGGLPLSALTGSSFGPSAGHRLIERYHCRVVAIDRAARTVTDQTGCIQPYTHLLLATGSRPFIPAVPGVELPGVYTFRDMDDANRLMARQARSRCTVVIGGGLLGLEAARAMRRANTHVVVIEHSVRLMFRQLDDAAAELLREHMQGAGIEVRLEDGLKSIHGDQRVEAVELRSGAVILCDTVVLATGIRPNIELALAAGLSVGRGIRVDDHMRTSDRQVYAIGECAEHDGQVYGLVAPGLEQAAVAAHSVAGDEVAYRGSIAATRLKVIDQPIFSVGRVNDTEADLSLVGTSFRAAHGAGYRRVVTEHGRLVGALAVGAWEETGRVQEAVLTGRRIWPWQLWRFRRYGRLWSPSDEAGVCDWPAATTVCHCRGVSRGRLGAAIAQGCTTNAALSAATGAATVCGSCRPLLDELLGSGTARTPERGRRLLTASAVIALVSMLPLLLAPDLPYNPSAAFPWQWDPLWRSNSAKQITGYSLLAVSLLALLLSLRKRWPRFTLGEFASWRALHAVLGAATLLGLLAHTGWRTGEQLNFYLMVSFVGLLAAGGLSALLIAAAHRLSPGRARRWRERLVWLHLLSFWPFPALLGVHILKSYYF